MFITSASRVAKHPLSADVKDLNHTFGVGGYAGKVRAVEDRALQGTRLNDRLLRLVLRRVIRGLGEQLLRVLSPC